MTEAWRQHPQLAGTGPGFGPPPPPISTGRIPPVRLKSELPEKTMDPPPCVQNAMMTKDKKPFTYTPGGIDLSQVRSPRMQRRIERNANLAGAGDVPKPPPPHLQNPGPLPPSALAAMRPQPQVQVFPSGPPPPPPMSRGGPAPPPPPPPSGAPPPPPPPTGPLPTQKVKTGSNEVLERPDMTKIIPDNPMAMLRKTGGPQPRRSLVDEMFAQEGKALPSPPTPPQRSPQYQQELPRYQPPVVERAAPIPPVPQQQQHYQPPAQSPKPQAQEYQPPKQYQPPVQEYQPPKQYQPPVQEYQPPKQYQPPATQQKSPEVKEPTRYNPPLVERQPSQRQDNGHAEVRAPNSALGSLYIPPAQNQHQQTRVVSPPSPPERNVSSPGISSPSLKEAPRPWQAKKPQQEEVPQWAKRENQVSAAAAPTQQHGRWPQSPPHQQQQQQQNQPIGVRIEIRTNPTPYQDLPPVEERKPNAVYVTQPLVLQHPGPGAPPLHVQPRVPPQQPKVDGQGVRIIPVKVEGNGTERPALNRQQSWGNPTQSNSFKIIQKLTQTDDDDVDESTPITEHSPKYPQNFQQAPGDQMRKLNLNEVSQSQPQGRQGPRIRTIPVQIEGDDQPQKYVHPSEQVVQEPKKYTGSSIPSRSFKMLQAMTAPDNCAKVDEQYEATPYEQWGYNPKYPPYPPPPYWHDPYYAYQYSESGFSGDDSIEKNSKGRQTPTPRQTPIPRQTPVPFWGYMPPPPHPYYFPRKSPSETENEFQNEMPRNTHRSTPTHCYGYGYPPQHQDSDEKINNGEYQGYPHYPPHFDPYYYSYYYGYYPPVHHPMYSSFYNQNENEDFSGYSSTEEMAYYNKTSSERSKRNSGLDATTPTIVVTPTLHVEEQVNYKKPEEKPEESEEDLSESDTDTEEDNIPRVPSALRSIKSVNNIHIYANEEPSDEYVVEECSEDSDENDEANDEDNSYIVDDEEGYPDQLSVIFEESERTESRIRSVSVMSDSTTIAEKSDNEDEYLPNLTVNVPLKVCVSVKEESRKEVKEISICGEEIKSFEETEVCVSYTLKSPSLTPRSRSLCRIETEENNQINDEKEKCERPYLEIEDAIIVKSENGQTAEVEEGKESDGSEDFWEILGKEEDLPKPNTKINKNEDEKHEEIESKIKIPELETSQIKNKANSEHVDADLKDNYAKETKTVYDEVIEESDEEETSVRLIEMESFVAKLEQLQKESGLWNTPSQIVSSNIKNKNSKIKNEIQDVHVIENTSEIKDKCEYKTINKEPNFALADEEMVKEMTEEAQEHIENVKENEDEVDFWSTINKDEDDYVGNKKVFLRNTDYDNNISSASYSNYNFSESFSDKVEEEILSDKNNEIKNIDQNMSRSNSNIQTNVELKDEHDTGTDKTQNLDKSDEEEESSEEESVSASEDENSEEPVKEENTTKEEQDLPPPTIKERIAALKNSIGQKQKVVQEEEVKISVKEKITAIETNQSRSKTTSTKSSLKSFEEFSEEEGDSGVTSDMSRHISDSEEFPELKKLTKYQRAATHSRLFKLLNGDCDNEDDDDNDDNEETIKQPVEIDQAKEDKFSKLSIRKRNGAKNDNPPRRDLLNLPLNKSLDSECSSGINSPGSPMNERLVNELVQSMLRKKKGQAFKNMPKEKLYAAATKILQENMELADTPEDISSFLSPLRGSTECSTAAETPQEFNSYDEYSHYYNSWSEAEKFYDENYDILPSKAFKLLQDHSNSTKTGAIAGLLAKCPRVLSSKNVHKKLIKLLPNPDSLSPDPPLETNEVTSAS